MEHEFTIWNRINTALDPDLKDKVINGELFRTACPSCGQLIDVVYPCLYHQMADKIMIYYVATVQLIVGNFMFVYMNMLGTYYVVRDCTLKKKQPFSYSTIRYALLTPLYWVFMSIAAYKALGQLFSKPFYWEKTHHGLSTTETTVTTG